VGVRLLGVGRICNLCHKFRHYASIVHFVEKILLRTLEVDLNVQMTRVEGMLDFILMICNRKELFGYLVNL